MVALLVLGSFCQRSAFGLPRAGVGSSSTARVGFVLPNWRILPMPAAAARRAGAGSVRRESARRS